MLFNQDKHLSSSLIIKKDLMIKVNLLTTLVLGKNLYNITKNRKASDAYANDDDLLMD